LARVLLVDDEPNLRRILGTILRPEGYEVSEAGSAAEARRAFAAGAWDVIVLDQKLPDGDGTTLLAEMRAADPVVPVLLLTAFATVELAVSAMRAGAFDVIAKPFVPEAVLAAIGRAAERTEILRENDRLKGQLRELSGRGDLVGESEPMTRVRELVARVGPTDATVLVTGETGTGKELVARALHLASPRASAPFLAVNCAGFTETLLESELFGHERGAFTGADRTRQGVFEAAHRGTLLLDEAGEMPPSLQAKLLRVLVDGRVTRVGATASRTVDVRIVAATHRDLLQGVHDGTFREDLYYRLAVVPISLPPLRDLRDDIPLLIAHLLEAVTRDLRLPPRTISAEAVAALQAYDFPGNVRELRNLLERAAILARGPRIDVRDLPPLAPSAAVPGADGDLRTELENLERTLVARALADAGGVQAEAARRLGLSRSHLAYRLKRLGLD
jgi:DNA-binding NtrC family response regulator